MTLEQHERYMRAALDEARRAAEEEEVPAGCVIVRLDPDAAFGAGHVIGRAHNQTERLHDPTAHAEMIAITQAAGAVGDWRLSGTVLYVTKEPCVMCAGAMVLARIPTVVFGAADPKRGGAVSAFRVLDHPDLNHRCRVIGGVLEEECRELLQAFFRARRGRPPDGGSRFRGARLHVWLTSLRPPLYAPWFRYMVTSVNHVARRTSYDCFDERHV
jgi:tRNA(adenine34) deaminase